MSDGITKADVKEYFNGRVHYMAKHHLSVSGRHRRLKDSLSVLIKPGMTVLDIGCGTGITSKHMAEIGAKVIGVDIADKLISYANKHSAHKNVEYVAEDVAKCLMPQRFDVIVMADVFEHLIREDVFMIIRRLTKHNTHDESQIYLNIPDGNFLQYMQARHPSKLQIVDEAHKIDDIVSLFSYCDFSPTHIGIYGLDTIVQYNEYVFRRTDWINEQYRQRLTAIYSKGENNVHYQ